MNKIHVFSRQRFIYGLIVVVVIVATVCNFTDSDGLRLCKKGSSRISERKRDYFTISREFFVLYM